MRTVVYLSLALVLNCCASAQPSVTKMSKRDMKTLVEARSALEAGKWKQASTDFTTLIDRYPLDVDLLFYRSVALKEQSKYELAALDIEKGISLSTKKSPLPYRKLAEARSRAGDFSGAKAAAREFLNLRQSEGKEGRIVEAEKIYRAAILADSLANNPVPFSPSPVSGLVNTKESFEYHPTISIDGKRLIFTRRVNREQEDFYFSEMLPEGTWGAPKPLEGINSEYDEGAQTISADGKYLVYTSCNTPGVNRGCDLYTAEWDGERWTRGKSLGSNINSQYYEAQPTLSQDGRFLIFASKRPGGKGGADLYISGRLGDDNWSTPVSMAALNTSGDEQYPFWAADGRTLYFTSNGHPGLGGDDLFFTQLQSDNTWSVPRNLGYPINTAENETNMFIPLKADVAYFSKRYYDETTEQTQIDLYQFPLPLHLRPAPATYVRARVSDREDRQALTARVTIEPFSASWPAVSKSTGENGEFLTVLVAGEEYAFTVDKTGYLFQSERFTLTEGTVQEPFLVEIQLSKIGESPAAETNEDNGAVAFKNVLFTSGSADLLPISFIELDRLKELLKDEPEMRVMISGHTDNVGEENDNLELSRRRAASVKTYLEGQGIEGSRIDTEGFGEARPVANNETAEGRGENRRTTFRLLR